MDDYGPYRDAWHPDNTTEIRYGCIRITDGTHAAPVGGFITNPGLYIHNNSQHISVGLTQVRIEAASGYLRIDTDGASNGAPIVTGDETAAVNRLMFGASGGVGFIEIKCSDGGGFVNLANQAEYSAIATANLNLWVAFFSPAVRA